MANILRYFFPKKEPKEKLNCLGVYDIKPFHYFESNFKYAYDVLIHEEEGISVHGRIFKETVLVFVLVTNESNYVSEKFTIDALREKLKEKLQGHFKNSVVLVIFKNRSEKTLEIAKRPVVNTKTDFYQAFIYNASKVRLEFFRPVPSFYKLYNDYLEAIYMDIAATDHKRA